MIFFLLFSNFFTILGAMSECHFKANILFGFNIIGFNMVSNIHLLKVSAILLSTMLHFEMVENYDLHHLLLETILSKATTLLGPKASNILNCSTKSGTYMFLTHIKNYFFLSCLFQVLYQVA